MRIYTGTIVADRICYVGEGTEGDGMFETDQECIDFLKGLEVQLTELLDLLVVAGRLPN